jgi:hypothetical protein
MLALAEVEGMKVIPIAIKEAVMAIITITVLDREEIAVQGNLIGTTVI